MSEKKSKLGRSRALCHEHIDSGALVRDARKSLFLSQEELCFRWGYSTKYLSAVERSIRVMDVNQLNELVAVMRDEVSRPTAAARVDALSQNYVVRPYQTRYTQLSSQSWHLHKIRAILEIPLADFAVELGVAYHTIHRWYYRTCYIPRHRVTEICDKLVVLANDDAVILSLIEQLRHEKPYPLGKPGRKPKKKKKGE